jgi:glyoxylase-like metal-dependent hydrolase (beta-lactamase superfamily II)
VAKKIGPYSLELLETGEFALDGGAMFGVVPKNIWQKTNPADDKNRITMALRVLVVRSKDRHILVDTGIGTKWDEKYQKIYRINHENNTLEKSLASAGIKTADITDVILTHLHFDHAGGCTCKKGGEIKPAFPNATHYIQKEQWDWAFHPTEKDRASFLKENFEPLMSVKLELLSGEAELFPGISILISHGHTPSMQLVKISDGKETLLYCADLIPTSAHIPIPYLMSYDNMPLVLMDEKRHILDQAVRENWILCFEHDPLIGAATVKKDSQTGRFGFNERITV